MKRTPLLLAAVALLVAMPAHSALTLGDIGVPDRVTVATTWNTLTLPRGTDYLVIKPITITGYWTANCTDGGALGTDYHTITADTAIVIAAHNYSRTDGICLAGSGSGTIEVVPMVAGK